MSNNYLAIVLIATTLFLSCKKNDARRIPLPTDPAEEITYTDLHEKEIKYNEPATIIDIDQDNTTDLIFSVWLVGDPVLKQDKQQFRISSGINTSMAVNVNEEVPAMVKNDLIPIANFNGYNWFKVSSIILVQRIENENGVISWHGNWQGAVKKYLPLQLEKNNQRYNGWVELTVDTANQKLVLHRLAMSKKSEKNIKAG